jgi:hypothetical protein
MGSKVSLNHTKNCWVLSCDIKKFFASIQHRPLLNILEKQITDIGSMWLLGEVIKSFHTQKGAGLPLGNLTSQLLVNIYMNEFDQFMKHELKIKYYIRYADDFVILSDNKEYQPYALPANEVLEVWRAKGVLSFDLPDQNTLHELHNQRLLQMMDEMRAELKKLSAKVEAK